MGGEENVYFVIFRLVKSVMWDSPCDRTLPSVIRVTEGKGMPTKQWTSGAIARLGSSVFATRISGRKERFAFSKTHHAADDFAGYFLPGFCFSVAAHGVPRIIHSFDKRDSFALSGVAVLPA